MIKKKKHKIILKKTSRLALKKFATAMLLVGLNVGVLNIPITNAFYNDEETSNGNDFRAGALDFALSPEGFDTVSASLNFEPGTTTSKTIGMALLPDSNPIKYQASTTDVSGDIPFCDAIDLSANLNNENQFSGSLTNFTALATTTMGSWQYDFSMPVDSHFYNNVCTFAFGYNGRQTSPHQEYPDSGYYDIEKATSTIYSWGFRINKVYYDVASDRGKDSANEWVEIYNQTDSDLDITGWQICDNHECDTIPASTTPYVIPAKGFGVITATSTTWKYWELADNVVPILLADTEIGNGLANGGDKLILKRPDGVIVDEMNWQDDTSVWNPGAVDVAKGHSFGRRPNGYDTNSASDFVDLAPPILALLYPNQIAPLTWYWTYNYNITWLATNPNGPNSDLKINLSYIKDIDGSNTITGADQVVTIGEDLTNTGIYNWTVPSGFIGYIWIKIAAFGPENPMLNTSATSTKIYDPFPLELLFTDPEIVLGSILDAMTPTSTTASSTATTTEDVITVEKVLEQEIEVLPDMQIASTTDTSVSGSSSDPSELPIESSEIVEIVPILEPTIITETEPIIESEPVVESIADEKVIAEEAVVETEPAIEPDPVSTPEQTTSSELTPTNE